MISTRTMLRTIAAAASLAATAAYAGNPHPAPACSSWTSVAPYATCTGSFPGNNSLAEANLQFSGYTFTRDAKDNQTAGGASDSSLFDLAGNASALTLSFNDKVTGPFAVSLKFGSYAAYYLFDHGVAKNTVLSFTGHLGSYAGYGLSHADVYTNAPSVPEPGTYALMLAGLGAVGFVARRRRA